MVESAHDALRGDPPISPERLCDLTVCDASVFRQHTRVQGGMDAYRRFWCASSMFLGQTFVFTSRFHGHNGKQHVSSLWKIQAGYVCHTERNQDT